MKSFSGNILKLESVFDSPIQYYLPIGEQKVHLNPFIEKKITINFDGQINCIATGERIKKSYNGGYSYKALISLAQCDTCIIKPELCHYYKGTCREPKWGEEHCLKPHVVYLSVSSDLKVGITREKNVPFRWIDQGAHYALPLVRVKDRLTSGIIEKELSKEYNDKTNWRKMLQGDYPELDLEAIKEEIFDSYGDLFDDTGADEIESDIYDFSYPVDQVPEKISSLNLDKTPQYEGVLKGIKGQYFIFEDKVINIRKYQGYFIDLSFS